MEAVNFRSGKLDFDGVDPELGQHLLELHWNRQHHSFLITYRPAFMRDMACSGPYFSKILLNAIYFGASKFSPRLEVRKDPNDVRTAGWKFRQRVKELLGNALDGSEITTIQALLVMTNSLFALGDERSAAWLYAGLAFRMIIDLGLQVDALPSLQKFSDEDLEIRRRVFWGAFVVDKIQSLYQGRPVSLQETDTRVPILFLDTYEELEQWAPFAYSAQSDSRYSGSPAYSVSTFTALCQLSVIMNDILNHIYAERSFDREPTELSKILENLHSKLEVWHNALPSHLLFDPTKAPSLAPPPHVLSLIAMYHVLLILLHRPFVADGHLYTTSRSISVNSFLTCATAASQIVRLLRAYDKAFSIRRAPYLISYATYVSATIHARIAAKRGPGSEARRSLETCLAVFRENQETNWAVRRAKVIVETLMKRLGVVLPEGSNRMQISDESREENEMDDDPSSASRSEINVDTEAVTPRQEGAMDHISPNLDIDAVIQSFAREQQEDNAFPERGYTSAAFPSSGMGYSMPRPHFVDPSTQATYYQHLSDFNPDINSNWQEPVNPSAVSIDDLLFGFSGSALDGYSIPGWP
ncbi:hypothetical protein W97_07730 [Coniosporium apollinis CBS 100218]|uniref:Xylanolytic transcriptional activator regulatory domain-containing protein n=1 Tax=Coniosporium apollinis (strain CBS 100218) TaxID=1168221 RepID=R7Z389_CONA1|nr:uncharacterized protein W97_07730 [Coniosporium apollinis CBS 100218]EON68406.1 hypothetical protein W97_07730 [Coniosporium apollinis CBS 100218]